MPNLYDLTEAGYTDPVSAALPVEQPYLGVPAEADGIRRVYITTPTAEAKPEEIITASRPEPRPEPMPSLWDNLGMAGVKDKSGKSESEILKKLFGLGGKERHQLWPEKVVREGLKAAGEVMSTDTLSQLGLRREDLTDIPAPSEPTKDSTWLGKILGIAPVAAQPGDDLIEKAQAVSALAGSGGLAGGVEGAALNATPSLRPALKYKDRLYKGKEGQQHMDVIPESLYPEFQKMAMSGEDISHYNFGFVNDKGQFLTREKALQYAVDTGLIDKDAGKYGALTSTLMADSSKPGTAIEAVGKSSVKSQQNEIKNLIQSAKDRNVELDASFDGYGNNYSLHWIESKGNKTKPREGTRVIKELADLADKNNKEIRLVAMADAEEGGMYLPKYYKALGFKETSKLGDNPDGIEMVRKPNAKMDKKLADKLLLADSSKEGAAIEAVANTGKTYPLAKPADRHTNTLGQNDNLIQNMSPDEFLKQSRPLKIDAESRETINGLKQHMKEGKPLDPLELHLNGKEDGRHRAIAAKELGIKEVPVLNFRPVEPKPTFYSAVEHNLASIPQSKMTGDQWLGTLANKPGVKGEELDWTGLKGFLEENKGKPVTKAQIEEHLANNKVELKEVSKGGEAQTNPKEYYDAQKKAGEPEWSQLSQRERSYWSNEADVNKTGNTKYHNWQLPGGENYREMLLTLPKKELTTSGDVKLSPQEFTKKYNELLKAGKPEEATALSNRQMPSEASAPYKSRHWDEPNILAHVRMNDRTIDGKKSLHLEEIQSDWHQQGRDKGYRVNQEKELADLVKQRDELKAQQNKLLTDRVTKTDDSKFAVKMDNGETIKFNDKASAEQVAMMPTGDVRPKWIELDDKAHGIQVKIDKIGAGEVGVPDAPFKKSWHELALKRMLREAAEKGYDRLSWTPGEAQVARYDLSKSISTVVYKDGKLTAIGPSGQHVINNKSVGKDKLSDFIGKEAAEKLLKQEPHNGAQTLQGEQLKVGGEGMKGFYDQIIPKALEKLGKEHGVKVKKENLNKIDASKEYDNFIETMRKDLRKEFYDDAIKEGFAPDKAARFADKHTSGETWTLAKAAGKEKELDQKYKAKLEFDKVGHQPVFYIDIPSSLKDTAMSKGFPLFSNGYMLVPVQGNPFEAQK